jgi:hypothetical protein
MYYLQHKRDQWRILTCITYSRAVSEYFRQWRDPDGSIPWTIEHQA